MLGFSSKLRIHKRVSANSLLFFAIFSFSLFWRIFGIARESLHVDEQVQAIGVSPSLISTWAHSRFLGMPPLDMTLTWFVVKVFGLNNFSIRVTPTFLGALSCALFALTISRLSKLSLGFLGGALTAVTPALIFQQQTARPYSLYICLIVSIFFFSTGPLRRDRMWMVVLLCILPWSRALEGPVSSLYLTILFSSIILLRNHTPIKAWRETKIMVAPLISCALSIIWTRSTENTIIGPPGNYLNSWKEMSDKLLSFPVYMLSLLKAILGFEFLAATFILSLIALASLLIKPISIRESPAKSDQPLITSLFSFVIWCLCNSLIIFLALYCLTRLQYFDRYFSLGIIGWLGTTILFAAYISCSDLRIGHYLSFLALLYLLIHFSFVSYKQAEKIDKIQFDQVNHYLISESVGSVDPILAYQPGYINQYLPGWPISIDSQMLNTPIWVTNAVKKIYQDKDSSTIPKHDSLTLVLLPSVDSRSNLLIGQSWEKDLFNSFVPSSKVIFLPGGAYILRNLTVLEFLKVVDIAIQKFPDSSNLWLSAYALAIADSTKNPVSSLQSRIFCNFVNAKIDIDQGVSFGLWGQPNIAAATFFREAEAIKCRNL